MDRQSFSSFDSGRTTEVTERFVPSEEWRYAQVVSKIKSNAAVLIRDSLGSCAAARDLVTIADAIDGPGTDINFVGYSYGSYIAMLFTQMFPERVGKVIFDGKLFLSGIHDLFHLR